ncbi:D-glycero-alpha-D-manno-heptose-1,7-bisphosphate 7-phosphatase [Candidatus Margulisiibacteriota bacterium]
MNKAVFLDRDGTIIKEKHFLKSPELVELEKNALAALKILQENGFLLIIITNQSGIARGIIKPEEFYAVQHHLLDLLSEKGIAIKGYYFCPHHPEAEKEEYKKDCTCRKPEPGMLLLAAKEHNISLTDSFMIGDKAADVEAGKKVNMKSILVKTGYGQKSLGDLKKVQPDYIADDLLDAVKNFILTANS